MSAADLIAARRVDTTETWTPSERRLALFVGQLARPTGLEADARAQALETGGAAADRLCGGFAAGTLFRLRSARPEPQTWDCTTSSAGTVCGFSGEAVCALDQRETQETEVCAVPGQASVVR